VRHSHRDFGDIGAEVARGDHRAHAGLPRGITCLDRSDAPVRDRAAQDRRMHDTGRVDVVNESAGASQQPLIFDPQDRLADKCVSPSSHVIAA